MLEHLRRLHRYRALIHILVVRELKARYRGSTLGFLWSQVNPLLLLVIYMLVFSVYMRMDMEGYTAYLFCGILAWNWFGSSLTEGAASILSNGALIRKVALPSEVFPLVAVLSNMVHYILSAPLLLCALLYYNIELHWTILLWPLLVLLQAILTYALTLLVASLSVTYRDILHILPNLLLAGFFLTPIMYPVSMVPERFRPLLDYNPLAFMIMSYQDVLFYHRIPGAVTFGGLVVFGIVMLVIGHRVFAKRQDHFAEAI